MQSDPYGLMSSGLPPDLAAQLVGLQGRQAIAQAMMQQSMDPLTPMPNKGELSSAISPFAALAKVLQAPLARMQMDSLNKSYADLASQAVQRRAQALDEYQKTRDGTPGTPAVPGASAQDAAESGGTLTEGTPATPGSPGNPRAAIMQAMLNPMLASNPVVQADMKKMEPNWKVEELYDGKSGQKQKFLINLNNPTEVQTLGGVQKKITQVTAAGPDGSPVTKFVVEDVNAAPIAQPVKKEMVNTGKVQVPVNPYNPEPLANTTTPGQDQSNATAIRGQNLHRQTSLQVAGLDEDGNPTGDIKQIATAIANGQMPPLSSFALSRPRGQQIMSQVYQINPNYNAQNYAAADQALKRFTSGKQGDTVRSFNVALNHLDTLENAANALQNGDVKAFNAVGQTIAAQTGATAPTDFDAVKRVVGNEIVKAVTGAAGALGDREEAEKQLSRANSPAQLRGVMNRYRELMRGQLGGLKQQYEQATGRTDFDRFLSEQGNATEHGAPSNVLRFDAQGNLLP